MDVDDNDDDDDRTLGELLREHANRLTDGLTDASIAYDGVAQRARARRGRRLAVMGGLAAAAAVTAVLVLASATGERAIVRTPATSPAPPTLAPSTVATTFPPTTVPSTGPTTSTATTLPAASPSTALPATSTIVTTPAPPPTAPPATSPPATSPPSPTTATYDGNGGSITVRLSDGVVMLVGAPSPAAGFTTRVDDNGPDRVRVRFERDDQRTEIRVDVENGRLVPRIDES